MLDINERRAQYHSSRLPRARDQGPCHLLQLFDSIVQPLPLGALELGVAPHEAQPVLPAGRDFAHHAEAVAPADRLRQSRPVHAYVPAPSTEEAPLEKLRRFGVVARRAQAVHPVMEWQSNTQE